MELGGLKAPSPSPRWATPVPMLNHYAQGGIYGVTGCAGSSGSGKSLFSMMTALRGAIDNPYYAVIYIAAEMTINQIKSRFLWLMQSWGYKPEALDALLYTGRLQILIASQSETISNFHRAIGESLHNPMALVVVDSVNSVLKMCSDTRDYWEALNRFLEPIIVTRRVTEGRLSACLISETNSEGFAKGRWEYVCDLMVLMNSTKTPTVTKISIQKNREVGGQGDLGEHRVTIAGAFERVSDFD